MAGSIQSSIIIPVFNQWVLTKACLQALATTTAGKAIEVIIIDNASSDDTAQHCQSLGERLFGSNFHYHRCEKNINFGPASNLGAQKAQGEFLIFLNNDTVPLEGWYQPLIDDFAEFPHIAATGPLLMYPKTSVFGYTVQHLGVMVSSFYAVFHLYEGIPADSPLAQKRRFFQVITGACMVMRRDVFIDVGLFDEEFKNGFEDVDLCARLSAKGYKMTVNPTSRVIHHTSQTPGRHTHEAYNSNLLIQKSLHLLTTDHLSHIKNDELEILVTPWAKLEVSIPQNKVKYLERIATLTASEGVKVGSLKELLIAYPYWRKGWDLLYEALQNNEQRLTLALQCYKLFPSIHSAFTLLSAARAMKDRKIINLAISVLANSCGPYTEYLIQAQNRSTWCRQLTLTKLANQCDAWLKDARESDHFKTQLYEPFLQKCWSDVKRIPLRFEESWAYNVWNHNVAKPRRALEARPDAITKKITFSLLMVVNEPNEKFTKEHLVKAIESVLTQIYAHWELCIAANASTDPQLKETLQSYIHKDSRIRILWLEQNENDSANIHEAAAKNAVLNIAHHQFVILLGPKDSLASNALCLIANSIAQNPQALLFYANDDRLYESEGICIPYLKGSQWDPELILEQNFVNHTGVYQTERLKSLNGFREKTDASHVYDMVLRYSAELTKEQIVHIPHVVYHWCFYDQKTEATKELAASALALQDYLDTNLPGALAQPIKDSDFLRVHYPLPKRNMMVSLIYDLKNDLAFIEQQLDLILKTTQCPHFEVLLFVSNAIPKNLISQAEQKCSKYDAVRIISYDNSLTSAEVAMFAAKRSKGAVLGFLNPLLVPTSGRWLKELVSCLCRENVGVVGGKIVNEKNEAIHCGYLIDGSNRLMPTFSKSIEGSASYFSWEERALPTTAYDLTKKTYALSGGLLPGLFQSV